MISPGFFGLYNAHRSLLTAQAALNTVNHNIANANTPGYSRQRVEIVAENAYAPPNIYQHTAGQVGQGSVASKIVRLRDTFLDNQFQNESSGLGLSTEASNILQQLEGILTEPSTQGINAALQNFFDAAQQLSLNPESQPVRSDFIQMANDLLSVFQQQANQLYNLNGNITGVPNSSGTFDSSQVGLTVKQINNKLEEIRALNQQIITIKSSGAEPNDLYDRRDNLLDQLSGLVDIQVERFDNGQLNLSIAGGTVPVIRSAELLNTLSYTMNAGPAPDPFDIPGLLTTTNGGVVLNDFTGSDIQSGALKGLLDMGQFNAADPTKINVRSMLGSLNTLFTSIATQVNTLQSTGRDLSGNVNGLNLFVTGAANPPGDAIQILSWEVNAAFKNTVTGPGLIAAAAGPPAAAGGVGDNRNALALAQLRNQPITALGSSSFVDYFNSLTSNLGIATRTQTDRTTAQDTLLNTLEQSRQSFSGVNTDEELIDMLRFQRAFESSSKLIKVFDEIYQTLINMT